LAVSFAESKRAALNDMRQDFKAKST